MRGDGNATEQDKIVINVDPELEDLVPGYLGNRQKDLESLREALTWGDYETIRVLGHKMKGSGGGYGFDAISRIGLALEQAAAAQRNAEIVEGLRELAIYLERIEVRYE